MSYQSALRLRSALARWQLRQRFDGALLAMMVLLTVFPVVNFLVSPGPGPAWVLALFLSGLGIAGVRLLGSAAKVAEISRLIYTPAAASDAEGMNRFEIRSDPPVSALTPDAHSVPLTDWMRGPEYLN